VGFRDDFIQAHPDMVRRYVTAVEIAKRIIWDSFQKDPKHVRDIYAQILKDKGGNSLLAKFFLPVSPDSTFIKDSDIQFWIDLLVAQGKLQLGQIHPSDVYTNDYDSIAKDAIKDN
jgi:ABC-type nitrate/sulfonate/bicarbonate transport system substrate-binding protein